MSKVEKKRLFDDDSGSDEDGDNDSKIQINKDYAQRYDEWREAEIKKKLEDKYGNLDEQLSSSSSDDDDPQELEKALSKDFFEVISQLRKKDPKIYDPEVRFFKTEEQPPSSQDKKKKEKPIYLRDYERKLIVERGGVLSDDEGDSKGQIRAASPSLAEKEKSLKESLQKVVHSDSDGNDDGLLIKKVKTADEKKKEDEDYLQWLRGRKEDLKDKSLKESLSYLKEEWNNPELDEGEKFLRDYVLNKRYLAAKDEDLDTGNITDEEYQEEYMDEFERKYNFRFEEPDSAFLKRYPRTIESSVRKKDDRRKRHREEVKKRKEEEKLRQREELKVLKSLKKKEILKKIEKLKEITGNAELGISDLDLDGDYDPEEHDRRMNKLFNDDYYQEGDDEMNLEELPLPPLEDELLDEYENWDEYEGEKEVEQGQIDEELHCEDPNFNMDCDFDPEAARLEKEARPKSSRERRKLKRQSRFGTLVRKKKPEFDPNEKSFQQYLDEYYGIDYEDIVGGQPCRFKYRKVMPNSFGLTIEEILAADDKELNAWVSIKKATALRPDHVELNDKRLYELKAQNEALKRKILPSLYKHETVENSERGKNETRSKKKKKELFGGETASISNENDRSLTENKTTSEKTNRRETSNVEETAQAIREDDPVAKVSPVKKKNKPYQKDSSSAGENLNEAYLEMPQIENKEPDQYEVRKLSKKEQKKLKRLSNEPTAIATNVEENAPAVREDDPVVKVTALKKKNKRHQNNSFSAGENIDEAYLEMPQIENEESNQYEIQKLSKKEKKKLKRLSNEPTAIATNVEENVPAVREDDSVAKVSPVKKKNKRHQNDSSSAGENINKARLEMTEIYNKESDQYEVQKLSKKEQKKLKRLSNESMSNVCENNAKSKRKGKKRPSDALDESIDDFSPSVNNEENDLTGSKTKQKNNENSQKSKKIKMHDGFSDKSPKNNFAQCSNLRRPSNPDKNKNLTEKDNKNGVLRNQISGERKRRRRRGKDRKKLLSLKKYVTEAPRDVKAENKARAIRKQNYKFAPVVGEISNSRFKAYGLNPKKFKNKLVYG